MSPTNYLAPSEETLNRAKPEIEAYFKACQTRAFKKRQIFEILAQNRINWGLPPNIDSKTTLALMIKHCDLREIKLRSEHYRDEVRFAWKDTSPYEIALSLKPNAYLSHGSAAFFLGLTDGIPKTIYVSYEQSPKASTTALTQERIDKAFAKKQRPSKLTYWYGDLEIVVLNGKFTGRLALTQIPATDGGYSISITKLERTLIDMTVRHINSGGVAQILKAFKRAQARLSVDELIDTLAKLEHAYPYHQAIGFYMERSGYPESELSKLRKLGTSFDFYLAHNLPPDKEYDPSWRLYYPGILDFKSI
jgi:predicted transcriptional regulator of viral defense system